MGKFEELERIQKLKDSGAITDKEFEVEKYKILNKVETNNTANTTVKRTTNSKLTAKLFFVLTIVGVIITIALIIAHNYYLDNVWWDIDSDYERAKAGYEFISGSTYYTLIQESKEEYEKAEKEHTKANNILDILEYGAWGTGGLTVIFLITGVVFKIKEKGGIKVVD